MGDEKVWLGFVHDVPHSLVCWSIFLYFRAQACFLPAVCSSLHCLPVGLFVSACQAPSLRLQGITGSKEGCNGLYVPTAEHQNGRPVFQQATNPDRWLWLATDQTWRVSRTKDKNADSNVELRRSIVQAIRVGSPVAATRNHTNIVLLLFTRCAYVQ